MTQSPPVPDCYVSLTEAARRIKSGQWSARWLTETQLTRIQECEPRLHSYARLRAEQALETAAALDVKQAEGAPLGLLHGVPIAIKDLLFLQGEIAASGTTVMQDYRPDYSATVVERLQRAGAVIIGQTQLTEGAFGLHHPALKAPVNPWGADHWPGVSSSGSGVAVSAGLAFGALGTDTGGSIRFPAACCGLVGIKPSYGRVSRYGAWPLAPSLDHIGPLARNVADAARILQVIAGADRNDESSSELTVPNYIALGAEDLAKVTVGIDWSYVSQDIDDSVVALMREVCELLQQLGATVKTVNMPAHTRTLVECWSETCGVEAARAHAQYYPERQDEYGPALRSLLEIGLNTSPERYQELEEVRVQFTRNLNSVFEQIDLLLTPALPGPVPTLAAAEGAATDDSQRADYLTFTAPFDYSGHPTLSLPAGLEVVADATDVRLPRALQLVGRPFGEAALISAGLSLESALNKRYGHLYTPGQLPC